MPHFQALIYGVETPLSYAADLSTPDTALTSLLGQCGRLELDWFVDVDGLAPVLSDRQVFGLVIAHTDPAPRSYRRAAPLERIAARRLGPAACLHLIRGLHADISLAQQQWAVVQLAAGAAGFALPEGRLLLIGGLC